MARAKFSELDEEKKNIIAKKCFIATIKANFRGSQIKKENNFASPQFILDKAQWYFDNKATANEKKQYLDKKEEYDKLVKSNGIYYKKDTKYQKYIEDIIKIDDMEELDDYIKFSNPSGKEIPIHQLIISIEDRTRAFLDKDGLYSKAKKKVLDYNEYKAKKKAKKNAIKSTLTEKENIILSKVTLTDFLTSDSIDKKEYCFQKGLSQNVFEKELSIIKEHDPEFYKEYLYKKNEKEQKYYEMLKVVVEDIIENVKNNKDYNLIDYCLKYHNEYKFDHLVSSCNKYGLDIRTLRTFLSKAHVKSIPNYLTTFLNQTYMIHNHIFTEQEKEQIYKYLKDNFIPINGDNVSLVVTRYYKDKQKNQNVTK